MKVIGIQQREQDIRAFLIAEAFRFIDRIVAISGLRRTARVGSLTTSKAEPKDVDILITVDDEAHLTVPATAARKLKGTRNRRTRAQMLYHRFKIHDGAVMKRFQS